jgi:signal transduction histidine kinase
MNASLRAAVLVVAVAAVGALGTSAVAWSMGMGGSEIMHLLALIAPAAAATVVVALLARRVLSRASLRQRFVATALIAAAVAIANIAALTMAMTVSRHDATLVGVLLLYSVAAGIAAALVLARSSAEAVERLGKAAERMGEGDLDARAGEIDAGPELDDLAATLDLMAVRLQTAQAREREAESMRRALITTVSHDLRTPLASMRAMVEAVDEGVVDDPPSLRRYTAEMRRSVHQLSDLVDDLFELTQLDAGAIEVETERILVRDAIADAIATVEASAERKRVTLTSAADGIEDTECSPRIVRVLQNLLVNAVRHTPSDGTVRVDARRSGSSLQVVVRDTGVGIAAEDLPFVFDPFFRADPARAGAGAGLGLALARRIVEALGGRIEAESRPGEGTAFAVVVPLA